MSDHFVSTTKENVAAPGHPASWRYRGRCSCGWRTHMSYFTTAAAETAVRRVHLTHITHQLSTVQ